MISLLFLDLKNLFINEINRPNNAPIAKEITISMIGLNIILYKSNDPPEAMVVAI